jgi:aerobic C4-dicarboxylate transport protein
VGHVPVAGLALILGIDRFMSEARALTNLVGNGVAAIVVGKWCAGLDEARLRAVLAGAGAGVPRADVEVSAQTSSGPK